jgi:hypothetical protein
MVGEMIFLESTEFSPICDVWKFCVVLCCA